MIYNKYIKAIFFTMLICVGGFSRANSQDLPKDLYVASNIPDSLKEDANSVIRYSSDEYNIKGPGKLYIKHHSLITILNEKGDRAAIITYSYNKKFDTYSYVDIHVYDETGKQIKKYHKSDMYDGAASDDETLVTDDRFLGLRHSIAKYPETIEIEYEEDISSYITLPSWYIQERLEQSVQEASIKVTVEPATGFRYEAKNTVLKPVVSADASPQVYTWTVKNLKAIKKEESNVISRVLPRIEFSTDKFNCFGYAGDIDSWKDFGKWMQGLNNDICTLTPARIAEIQKMTDSIKTDKAKAMFLYKYMQENMRYVSIQLGIGGYKPFAATFVDEKKYGDCKALSNYMKALLKAVNIPSYCTLIEAGENEASADFSFPHYDFNHEILCIPFKNDTTWLECTSNKAEFGKLGSFTENRTALLITDDGGKLVNTPKSKASDNEFNSEVHLQLQPDGSAKAHVKISSTGDYRLFYIESAAMKLDDQKQFWLGQLQIKQPSNFDLQLGKDTNYTKQVDMDLEYDKFCDVIAGDKQFYRPSVFKLWGNTVPITEKRRTDFYWEYPGIKTCTTTIDLPQGFEVESLPANASLKFTYGNYDVSYTYNKDKNQVISTAKFVLNSQMIPAAKYTEMQEYMDAIARAQNKKLVLRKKA